MYRVLQKFPKFGEKMKSWANVLGIGVGGEFITVLRLKDQFTPFY